jgi:hypothetical protein
LRSDLHENFVGNALWPRQKRADLEALNHSSLSDLRESGQPFR